MYASSMPCPEESRQITKVTRLQGFAHLRTSANSGTWHQRSSFIPARGADLAEDVLLDGFIAFVDNMQEADAVLAALGEDVGDVEIAEGGDEFPAVVVELPNFELLETVSQQSPVARWDAVKDK